MTPVVMLRHAQLHPSPLNPRKHARGEAEIAELAASIADRGVLQNLVVRASTDGNYEIAAGEGRWRAVPALIDAGKADGDFELPCAVRVTFDDGSDRLVPERHVRAAKARLELLQGGAA